LPERSGDNPRSGASLKISLQLLGATPPAVPVIEPVAKISRAELKAGRDGKAPASEIDLM
jgi:hypothetical protein